MQPSLSINSPDRAFAALRRFTRRPEAVTERCELCGVDLAMSHDHLIEPKSRRLLCACQACSLLFDGAAKQKYGRVPRLTRYLPDLTISSADWDSLLIPINIAFFFHSSPVNKVVAIYPSPAGPVESLLSLSSWQSIARGSASLSALQPDVEALLVNRMGPRHGFAAEEHFLTPIDQCFKLVGLLRTHWRGLSGGTEVWEEVRRFFEELKRCALTVQERQHA
jgi:hypothetical protein